ERLGEKLLAAVRRGLSAPPAAQEPPRPERARRNMRQERAFEKLRQWRKQAAEQEQLDPGAILSAAVLQEMARRSAVGEDPLDILSPVKRRRYAESLRRLLGE
ncbi:MAG: HRDC domain-containing protein, partial [Elusimicrobia bacterium]|nr:HRDC domain-containing protein [Elusimicrobiota bacterium]